MYTVKLPWRPFKGKKTVGAKLRPMIGEVFGRLTVQSLEGKVLLDGGKKRLWRCRCSCGKEALVPTNRLESGNTKSCGCLHNDASAENSKKTRHLLAKGDAGFRNVFRSYRRQAEKRGLAFLLVESTFRQLVEANCHYCGAPPSNCNTKHYHDYFYNGVDRLDNTLGYTEVNVVTCCGICNHAKHTLGYTAFLAWVKRVSCHLELHEARRTAEARRE